MEKENDVSLEPDYKLAHDLRRIKNGTLTGKNKSDAVHKAFTAFLYRKGASRPKAGFWDVFENVTSKMR